MKKSILFAAVAVAAVGTGRYYSYERAPQALSAGEKQSLRDAPNDGSEAPKIDFQGTGLDPSAAPAVDTPLAVTPPTAGPAIPAPIQFFWKHHPERGTVAPAPIGADSKSGFYYPADGRPVGTVVPPATRPEGTFSFAVISDLHVGEGAPETEYKGEEYPLTARARQAVARINAIAQEENIAFVFVTGDLTGSAQAAQFAKAHEILAGLSVPWFPLLGNHDVWTYSASTEASAPAGDQLFAQTFADRFAGVVHEDEMTTDPRHHCPVRLQNFEVRKGDFVFIGLDWNTRKHAMLGNKGSMPNADMHDFPGGTLPWLRERLAALPPTTKRVFFFQHHPFRIRPPIPDEEFSFGPIEKDKFRAAISAAPPLSRYFGVFDGHTHLEYHGTAFDQWPNFAEHITAACKDSSAITLARVFPDGSVEVVPNP